SRTIDARLTLSGPAEGGAPGTARPDLLIALQGPAASPQRSVDVSALVSWLMLRSLDRETRRMEAVGAGRHDPAAPPPAAGPGDGVTAAVLNQSQWGPTLGRRTRVRPGLSKSPSRLPARSSRLRACRLRSRSVRRPEPVQLGARGRRRARPRRRGRSGTSAPSRLSRKPVRSSIGYLEPTTDGDGCGSAPFVAGSERR